MGRVILTAEMQAKLENLIEKQELRDEQGRLIGYFEPLPKKLEAWGPFTADEVAAALARKGPYRTFDEIQREFETR